MQTGIVLSWFSEHQTRERGEEREEGRERVDDIAGGPAVRGCFGVAHRAAKNMQVELRSRGDRPCFLHLFFKMKMIVKPTMDLPA